MSNIFRNPFLYTSDRGLSQQDQPSPLSAISTDARFMKGKVTEAAKAGNIVGASDSQSFVPYQTKYESLKQNPFGITRQNNPETPWVQNTANTWADPANFPPSFKGDFDIEGWYATKLETPKELYTWKTDIFGNQYGLYKDFGTPTNPVSIYNKKHAFGDLWVNDANGKVAIASTALSGLYFNYSIFNTTIYNELTAGEIKDIDVFYDTLILVTQTHITLDKILFDYETGKIDFAADYTHTINLSGGKFSDIWFFEEIKKVLFCSMSLLDNIPTPYIWNLDIDHNFLQQVFPTRNTDTTLLNQLSSFAFVDLDYPVVTFNETTKIFAITFYALRSEDEISSPLITLKLNYQTGSFLLTDVLVGLPN